MDFPKTKIGLLTIFVTGETVNHNFSFKCIKKGPLSFTATLSSNTAEKRMVRSARGISKRIDITLK